MKRIITFFTVVLLAGTVLLQHASAQSPEKMSYQAVIRNSSNNLVTSTAVGMQISILQGSISGTVAYAETQTPTTNANGLASIEIGTGTVVSGTFSAIDWANGPYFIKTETDPDGGTNYTITGTSQLLSVPYALHAKTAESTTEVFAELDPVYSGSQAANITASDIVNLSNLSGTNTGDQDGSETKINGGTNISVSGSGTSGSPYVVNSTGLTDYATSSSSNPYVASTSIGSSTITDVLQLTGVPAGTYAVFFSCPLRNTSTSSNGLNIAWSITANDATPGYPEDGIATSFIPATGWSANYIFGQSGFKVITLGSTGTIELKIVYYGSVSSGYVRVAGTAMMRAIRL